MRVLLPKKNQPPPDYDWHKNWDGPSASMETNILVEGFKESEKKYGLRYMTFVVDGECSVYPTLIAEIPGWGHSLQKL